MNGFTFALKPTVTPVRDEDGFSLVSRVPLRMLRVNEPLYRIVSEIREGVSPSYPPATLRTLLSLVSSGYLSLTGLPEPAGYPRISVIIPVKDQPDDLAECLEALMSLDYPPDRLEIIVVDDGSEKDIAQLLISERLTVLRQSPSRGQAAARNLGAEKAGGELLAFLDADCMAGEDWLRELVPFFDADGVKAVGGSVSGYYRRGLLDRYEAVASSLNMGKRLIIEGASASTFYVPTANLIVDRDAFRELGGFNETMSVGEDVDFCWRLREAGHVLLYAPGGDVAHKHRNHLGKMLLRRLDYGTSEAPLYRAHRGKVKTFVISPFGGLSFLAVMLSVLLVNPYPLLALPLSFMLDMWRMSRAAAGFPGSPGLRRTLAPALRGHLSFIYFAGFHLVRYYLVVILALGFAWPPFWWFAGTLLVIASVVDYVVKKPRLLYPFFLFFYLAEHVFYQVGVFLGCVKRWYFGSYRVSFRKG